MPEYTQQLARTDFFLGPDWKIGVGVVVVVVGVLFVLTTVLAKQYGFLHYIS